MKGQVNDTVRPHIAIGFDFGQLTVQYICVTSSSTMCSCNTAQHQSLGSLVLPAGCLWFWKYLPECQGRLLPGWYAAMLHWQQNVQCAELACTHHVRALPTGLHQSLAPSNNMGQARQQPVWSQACLSGQRSCTTSLTACRTAIAQMK